MSSKIEEKSQEVYEVLLEAMNEYVDTKDLDIINNGILEVNAIIVGITKILVRTLLSCDEHHEFTEIISKASVDIVNIAQGAFFTICTGKTVTEHRQ